jgi:hypothetical protein
MQAFASSYAFEVLSTVFWRGPAEGEARARSIYPDGAVLGDLALDERSESSSSTYFCSAF